MKQRVNNWAHRNLAEILIVFFLIGVATLAMTAYNLWDTKDYQHTASGERKKMITGIAATVHNDSIQIRNQDSLKEAAFKKNMEAVNKFINKKK